jgi:hypothetical protein
MKRKTEGLPLQRMGFRVDIGCVGAEVVYRKFKRRSKSLDIERRDIPYSIS